MRFLFISVTTVFLASAGSHVGVGMDVVPENTTSSLSEANAWTIVPMASDIPRGQILHGRFRDWTVRVPAAVTPQGVFRVASTAVAGEPTWDTWANGLSVSSTFLVGDFNGDRLEDLLEVTTAGSWIVRHSTGSAFTPASTYLTNQVPTARMFVGDFTGEGKDDVAVIVHAELKYQVAVSNPTAVPPRFDLETWLSGYGQSELNLVGDFSGDGRADLLIGFPGSPAAYHVARSTPAHTFVYEIWLASTTATSSPADRGFVGDFDNDGFDDVLVMNGPQFQWHILRASGGTFVPSLAISGLGALSTTNGRIGDFNGDGKDDVAYAAGSDVGQVLSQGTTFSLGSSQLPVGVSPTEILSAYMNPGTGADDAADVMIRTDGGGFLGHSNNIADQREVVARHAIVILGLPGDQSLYSPISLFKHPAATPLFLTEVVEGVEPGGYPGPVAVDTCLFLFRATVPRAINDDVTCGFQSQTSSGSPLPVVPMVHIPASGLPILPGKVLESQGAARFTSVPQGGFPGTYAYRLTLRKSGATTLQRLRVPFTDEFYPVNSLEPGGGYSGSSGWQRHHNTSTGPWYVKAVSIFHSNIHPPFPAGEVGMALYVLEEDGVTVKSTHWLVSQTWNGSAGYTAPAPVYFTPPVVVEADEWVVAQAHVFLYAAPGGADTAFYIFADSTP